jgi:hypothetical protein
MLDLNEVIERELYFAISPLRTCLIHILPIGQ